jgi:hypothetical protein
MNRSLKELIAKIYLSHPTKSEKKAQVEKYRGICNIENKGNGINVCKHTNAGITRFPHIKDISLFNRLAKEMAEKQKKSFPLSLSDIQNLHEEVAKLLKEYEVEVAQEIKIQERQQFERELKKVAELQEEKQRSLEMLHQAMQHAEQLAAEAREAQQRANIAKQASEAAVKAHAAILEKIKDAEKSLELKEKKFSA